MDLQDLLCVKVDVLTESALYPSGEDTMSEFSRVIGRRTLPPAGVLRAPTGDERAWVAAMSQRRTRVISAGNSRRRMRRWRLSIERGAFDSFS